MHSGEYTHPNFTDQQMTDLYRSTARTKGQRRHCCVDDWNSCMHLCLSCSVYVAAAHQSVVQRVAIVSRTVCHLVMPATVKSCLMSQKLMHLR